MIAPTLTRPSYVRCVECGDSIVNAWPEIDGWVAVTPTYIADGLRLCPRCDESRRASAPREPTQ